MKSVKDTSVLGAELHVSRSTQPLCGNRRLTAQTRGSRAGSFYIQHTATLTHSRKNKMALDSRSDSGKDGWRSPSRRALSHPSPWGCKALCRRSQPQHPSSREHPNQRRPRRRPNHTPSVPYHRIQFILSHFQFNLLSRANFWDQVLTGRASFPFIFPLNHTISHSLMHSLVCLYGN